MGVAKRKRRKPERFSGPVKKRKNVSHFPTEVQELIGGYCQGNGVDLGCGWRKMGEPICGIDMVPWSSQSGGTPDDPHYSQADWCYDCRSLPLKDNVLDFVFSHHLLEHVGKMNVVDEDTRKALAEWVRVLKSGGHLVCVVPDINHCISPVARKRGKIVPHGLQPDPVWKLLDRLPVDIVRFNELEARDIFDIVAVKL